MTEPSHWAVLLYEDTALCDAETGEVVERTPWTGTPKTSPTLSPQKV